MKSNQNINNNSQNIVDKNQKVFLGEDIQNLNYLYPNGHRITYQMRWFKGSRYTGFESDLAA